MCCSSSFVCRMQSDGEKLGRMDPVDGPDGPLRRQDTSASERSSGKSIPT